jgi:Carboxypeptidase regulatory-like domain
MNFRPVRIVLLSLFLIVFLFFHMGTLQAQTPTSSLSGVVTDPSGAIIAKAAVRLLTSSGASLDTTTNKDGVYEFKGLAPGTYTLKSVSKGFALFTKEGVQIAPGQAQQLNIGLTIQIEEQKIEVEDSPTKLDVDPSNNAGMVVLKGKDLEALSDDPDELQSELQALAGPSAGPNGGQIYIDGFTAGTLPPKASIREIRINQNPFSAEYDRLGYGRIEIFTKPGTDQFHGQVFLTGNTAGFNSRNPFESIPPGTQPPGYHSTQFSANIGGPLISKKASFFFNIEQRNIDELSVVSAQIVDPTTFAIVPFSEAVPNPRTRTNLSPRFDYQVSANNTLTARYQYERENETNNGVGQFSLPSLGFNEQNREHQLQISDTQIVNSKIINETRFRFVRETNGRTPLSTAPTISVQDAFTDGGNGGGISSDTLDRYELQNYTSMSLGKHFLKFGARLRATRDSNESRSGYNGSFNFGLRQNPTCPPNSTPATCPRITGLQAYQMTVQGLAQGTSLAQIIAAGGGASQYSITTGTALADVTYFDAGLYFQDDWRVRPNITVSYGLRFESQNNIGDHADLAPRIGIAWGLDGNGKKAPKTVLRGGFGIFYDRFGYDLVLQQERLNNITQQQFIVANPQFYLSDTLSTTQLAASSATAPTLYQPNPNLRTPYTMQTGLTLERQLTKSANLSVTYLNARGVHQFFTENINAPICTISPCVPAAAPHPLGNTDNIYQYQSEGVFKQRQLIIYSSVRMGAKLSLSGYYTLNYANSDASGAGTFPSTLNNISLDYGRGAFDVRHRVFFGGTMGLPYNFRLSPFLVAQSGVPFNITTGQDLNGDSIYNDRPAFASPHSIPQNVVTNRYGSFDLLPQSGEAIVPINSLTSAGRFSLNLRLSKSFGFGQKKEATNTGAGGPGAGGTFGRGPGGPGGGGPRGGGGFGGGRGGGMDSADNNSRYNLTFSVSARNVFNNVNLATPIGNLSSPLFGQANGLAGGPYSSSTANRRIDLQVSFNF